MLKSIEFEHPIGCVKTLNEDLIGVCLLNSEIKIYNLIKMEIIKTITSTDTSSNVSLLCLKLLSNGNLVGQLGYGKLNILKIFE